MPNLRLKVPQQEYENTLRELTTQIGEMKSDVRELEGAREQILNNYSGNSARLGVNAVNEHIAAFNRAIADLEKRKAVIEQYLTSMGNQDKTAQTKYEEAANAAKGFFTS